MKKVKGDKLIEIANFAEIAAGFDKVVADLGCGDGRYVYKNALVNPKTLYIGVDPAIQQADEYARKASRKKLNNALFVSGSYEILPTELYGLLSELKIILPWGSLLAAVAQPTNESVAKLSGLLKPNGHIEIILGYDSVLEPTQTARLDLQELDESYIKNNILAVFEANGFKNIEVKKMRLSELKKVESTWGKKISLTATRPIFTIMFEKNQP